MKKIKTKLYLLTSGFVAFAMLFSLTGIDAFVSQTAGDPNQVDVLIGFTQVPGPNEQALVRGQGGVIKYSYHLVPAIAASIPETAIAGLLRNPHVTSVDPDGTVYAVDIELDNSWGVKQIGAGTVHDGSNKGTGVKVAIIDSGIDYNHPDLDDNFDSLNRGYDFVYGDDDPMDVYGHGTHVAGTACAEDNDNGNIDPKLGVVGVAPNCVLYSLRVLNDDGVGSWSRVIAAMEWAVDNGMEVANLSLGSSRDPGGTVETAFNNAETAGMVIVAAAGNSGTHPSGKRSNVIWPARYDSVIAVAATDSYNKLAEFSSTGEQVELAAPGVNVYSTWNDDTSYSNPQPVCRNGDTNDCYKYGSGTSMASPHVAGVAALVIVAGTTDNNDNGRINDEVRLVMNNTADDLGDEGRDPQYGFGLVNAVAAVEAAAPPATGTISGTVTDAGTLDVIAGATVTDGTRSTTTDINGAYTIADVPEGTYYTVTASATDYNSASQADVVVTADVTTTVDFALTAIVYGAIDGTVTDIADIVISGATVTDGIRSATTDSNGYYLISDVPEGTYTVTASATGYQEASQSVVVTGDLISTANFSLRVVSQAANVTVDSIIYATEGGRNQDKHLLITIALVDDFGSPVADVSVSIDLYHDGNFVASGTGITGTNGTVTFKLNNAPLGCYVTTVTDVTTEGLTWDGLTPDNGFCKE